MTWPSWKNFEKEVATFFGGKRHIRINRAESHRDIDGVLWYTIECKYGGQVPGYLICNYPTELTVGDKAYRLLPSQFAEIEDGLITYEHLGWDDANHPNATFLKDALSQAEAYAQEHTTPLVCVKRKNQRGFIIIWEVDMDKICVKCGLKIEGVPFYDKDQGYIHLECREEDDKES